MQDEVDPFKSDPFKPVATSAAPSSSSTTQGKLLGLLSTDARNYGNWCTANRSSAYGTETMLS